MSQLHDLEVNTVPLSGHLIGNDLSNVRMLPFLVSLGSPSHCFLTLTLLLCISSFFRGCAVEKSRFSGYFLSLLTERLSSLYVQSLSIRLHASFISHLRKAPDICPHCPRDQELTDEQKEVDHPSRA